MVFRFFAGLRIAADWQNFETSIILPLLRRRAALYHVNTRRRGMTVTPSLTITVHAVCSTVVTRKTDAKRWQGSCPQRM